MLKVFRSSWRLRSRKVMAVGLLLLILGGIGAIFWYQAYIYSLPTEVPRDYEAVAEGTRIQLERHVSLQPGKPVFLHFFNPDCPCSRFNLQEFKSIARAESVHATFVIVVLGPEEFDEGELRERFGLEQPIIFDKALARECGVYSTPQAVILDDHFRLHYRGNYNKSRYCTDRETSYARIALDDLFSKRRSYAFGPTALKAYGCSIENCVE